MDFDFTDLTAKDEPEWFVLVHPATGVDLERNGAPVRLALLGPDTGKMIAFENKISERRLKQVGRTGKLDLLPEEIEADATARAVASIVGWENFALGGDELIYTEATAKDLITSFRWLRDFWQEKFNQRGNFLGTAEISQKK
jgi:hypothetical protein